MLFFRYIFFTKNCSMIRCWMKRQFYVITHERKWCESRKRLSFSPDNRNTRSLERKIRTFISLVRETIESCTITLTWYATCLIITLIWWGHSMFFSSFDRHVHPRINMRSRMKKMCISNHGPWLHANCLFIFFFLLPAHFHLHEKRLVTPLWRPMVR